MEVEAFAKVNLSLRLRARDASGRHPLRSLAQSIDWADCLGLAAATEDAFTVTGLALPDDDANLERRAPAGCPGRRRPARARWPSPSTSASPSPPAWAGAAPTPRPRLVLAASHFGLSAGQRDALAPGLGADVPFCLVGGTAWMEGYGERLTPVPPLAGFWLAVVVPPFEVSTAAAYRRWDELEGPAGPEVSGRDLPPEVRPFAPLGNDLVPAARSLVPELGDWAADLQRRWGRAVLMSGSGPALFGFFPTASEAEGAAAVPGARGARACRPVPTGWRVPSGTLP